MAQLQPQSVFDCFAQINKVPRPSKREEKITAFLRKFGEDLGLETLVDEAGNVLIRKPGTPGYENRKTVILQSHQDMVCEKNKDVEFDFDNDAIQTYVDGDWLKAKGTTLGADDGIGIAMEMALLQATDIEHGPIECVFTRDEETGLTGAFEMKPGFMSGDYLINLDSEDEGQLFVSCAGGVRTEATYTVEEVQLPEGFSTFNFVVKGLTGGHSGDDINKNRANANKLLVRFLLEQCEKTDLRLCDIQAGGLHNAIPREAHATWPYLRLCCDVRYRTRSLRGEGARGILRNRTRFDGSPRSGGCCFDLHLPRTGCAHVEEPQRGAQWYLCDEPRS